MYRYINEELDTQKLLSIEQHIKHCGSCAEKIAHLTRIKHAMDALSPAAYIKAKRSYESLNKTFWRYRVKTAIDQALKTQTLRTRKYLVALKKNLYDKAIAANELSLDKVGRIIDSSALHLHSLMLKDDRALYTEIPEESKTISFCRSSSVFNEPPEIEIKYRVKGRRLEISIQSLPYKYRGPLFALLVPASEVEEPQVVPLRKNIKEQCLRAHFDVVQAGKYLIFIIKPL